MALVVVFNTAQGERWFTVETDGCIRPQSEDKRDFLGFIFHPFSWHKKADERRCTIKGFSVKAQDGSLSILSVGQVYQRANERDFLKRLNGAMPVGYRGAMRNDQSLGQIGYAYFE